MGAPQDNEAASHFFASLTPNSATGEATGSPRLRLDKSMTLLDQHLAAMQLQQDWVNADPATAFFLAIALQMDARGLISSSPLFATKGALDFLELAEGLAEKVVAHLSAHPELRSSPVTAAASAAAAAATAGNRHWRRAVEDESGCSLVGDGMISAAAHLLEVNIVKLSVGVEGLLETLFPPPQGATSKATLVVVYVGGVVWSTSPRGTGVGRGLRRVSLGAEGTPGQLNVEGGTMGAKTEWVSQEAIREELNERLVRARGLVSAVKWFSAMRAQRVLAQDTPVDDAAQLHGTARPPSLAAAPAPAPHAEQLDVGAARREELRGSDSCGAESTAGGGRAEVGEGGTADGGEADGRGGAGGAELAAENEYVLLDMSGLIFRSFYGMGALNKKGPSGVVTNAVFGVCRILQQLQSEVFPGRRMVAVFDHPDDTFRTALLPAYKAQRPPVPEDLKAQFSLVKEAVAAFGIPRVEVSGYEADDVIATVVTRVRELARLEGTSKACVVVSSDKDLYQLVSEDVRLWDPYKRVFIGRDGVLSKFGVGPERVVDVQSLAGDSADNIPGVPGIGLKTAAKLVQQFGGLDAVLERAEEIKSVRTRQAVQQHTESVRVCRKLVTLAPDAPLPPDLDLSAYGAPSKTDIQEFLSRMGFKSLLAQMEPSGREDGGGGGTVGAKEGGGSATVSAVEHAGQTLVGGGGGGGEAETMQMLGFTADQIRDRDISRRLEAEELAEVTDWDAKEVPEIEGEYALVTDMEEVEQVVAGARLQAVVAIHVVASSESGQSASLMGIAVAVAPGRGFYMPVGHSEAASFSDAFSALDEAELVQALSPLLEDPGVLKVGHNMKLLASILRRVHPQAGLPKIAPFDDTMLMSAVVDAGRRTHELTEIARHHLRLAAPKLLRLAVESGLAKPEAKLLTPAARKKLPPSVLCPHSVGLADLVLRLHVRLRPLLAFEGVSAPYQLMEQPLVDVLLRMEERGVGVDRDMLEDLSRKYAGEIARLEAGIFKIAGRTFSISSPKQLAAVLFEELKLPAPSKRLKGGEFSTGAEVLSQLIGGGHEIARLVDEWRALTKLKSTYSDPLVAHINTRTGRIHTSYQMAATATGRLSSADPNLQNIPTSGEGGALRDVFVAPTGCVLLSADYSQIELRLLAHMAQVPALQSAFANEVDVHRLTASQVFGVAQEDVTDELRRRAKAINFGIIYGQSSFGLSKALNISVSDAKEYIDTYFAQYPGIAAYMDSTKASAKQRGYVGSPLRPPCPVSCVESI